MQSGAGPLWVISGPNVSNAWPLTSKTDMRRCGWKAACAGTNGMSAKSQKRTSFGRLSPPFVQPRPTMPCPASFRLRTSLRRHFKIDHGGRQLVGEILEHCCQ
jgi:hypothetical protein